MEATPEEQQPLSPSPTAETPSDKVPQEGKDLGLVSDFVEIASEEKKKLISENIEKLASSNPQDLEGPLSSLANDFHILKGASQFIQAEGCKQIMSNLEGVSRILLEKKASVSSTQIGDVAGLLKKGLESFWTLRSQLMESGEEGTTAETSDEVMKLTEVIKFDLEML